ncbi:hypothetical protein BV898_16657 [Hypsibius exemplaris]|uniref:Uncharacterized protein n=1 Tax=Hypsibius exemplaris TaxID=2072580 RepID=A0A9X6NFR8_HYPEX|nr:hypothetical protein BV898_16657 [Hypsibius exemplaris]
MFRNPRASKLRISVRTRNYSDHIRNLSKYTQCEKNPRNSPNRRKEETIIGIAWSLGTKKDVGHASKGGMTFIWQTDASDQKKPCDYESITKR